MEKIKKISKGFALGIGFFLMLGVWSYQVAPSMTNLITDAVTLIPEPRFDNPVPQCSECVETRGINPRCINVCLQEVIFKTNYSTKNYLEFLTVK